MRSIEELKSSKERMLILHYACTDTRQSPVIVTSISVRDYQASQTSNFGFEEYGNEANLLSAFSRFMGAHSTYIIVTWNQKSNTYGIQHLVDRSRVNSVAPELTINRDNIVDLDDVLAAEYGRKYAQHPKLRYMMELNEINSAGFVDGAREPELFEERNYRLIQNSTNRKVAVLAELFYLTIQGELRTDRPNSIFIVHGHDLRARDALDVHLRNLGLETVILDQKPSQSLPLMLKFEQYANKATLAICILTPDDQVITQGNDEERRRARQNVILEMGYFFGRLGRNRVILLYKGDVEVPSDIYGITYVKFESIESAFGKIDQELQQLKML